MASPCTRDPRRPSRLPSFKRSFDEVGSDSDNSDNLLSSGSVAVRQAVHAVEDHADRNKRARSDTPLSDPGDIDEALFSSDTSSTFNGSPNSIGTNASSEALPSGSATEQLPSPTQFEARTGFTPDSPPAPNPSEQYSISMERFDAFESNISVLRHSHSPEHRSLPVSHLAQVPSWSASSGTSVPPPHPFTHATVGLHAIPVTEELMLLGEDSISPTSSSARSVHQVSRDRRSPLVAMSSRAAGSPSASISASSSEDMRNWLDENEDHLPPQIDVMLATPTMPTFGEPVNSASDSLLTEGSRSLRFTDLGERMDLSPVLPRASRGRTPSGAFQPAVRRTFMRETSSSGSSSRESDIRTSRPGTREARDSDDGMWDVRLQWTSDGNAAPYSSDGSRSIATHTRPYRTSGTSNHRFRSRREVPFRDRRTTLPRDFTAEPSPTEAVFSRGFSGWDGLVSEDTYRELHEDIDETRAVAPTPRSSLLARAYSNSGSESDDVEFLRRHIRGSEDSDGSLTGGLVYPPLRTEVSNVTSNSPEAFPPRRMSRGDDSVRTSNETTRHWFHPTHENQSHTTDTSSNPFAAHLQGRRPSSRLYSTRPTPSNTLMSENAFEHRRALARETVFSHRPGYASPTSTGAADRQRVPSVIASAGDVVQFDEWSDSPHPHRAHGANDRSGAHSRSRSTSSPSHPWGSELYPPSSPHSPMVIDDNTFLETGGPPVESPDLPPEPANDTQPRTLNSRTYAFPSLVDWAVDDTDTTPVTGRPRPLWYDASTGFFYPTFTDPLPVSSTSFRSSNAEASHASSRPTSRTPVPSEVSSLEIGGQRRADAIADLPSARVELDRVILARTTPVSPPTLANTRPTFASDSHGHSAREPGVGLRPHTPPFRTNSRFPSHVVLPINPSPSSLASSHTERDRTSIAFGRPYNDIDINAYHDGPFRDTVARSMEIGRRSTAMRRAEGTTSRRPNHPSLPPLRIRQSPLNPSSAPSRLRLPPISHVSESTSFEERVETSRDTPVQAVDTPINPAYLDPSVYPGSLGFTANFDSRANSTEDFLQMPQYRAPDEEDAQAPYNDLRRIIARSTRTAASRVADGSSNTPSGEQVPALRADGSNIARQRQLIDQYRQDRSTQRQRTSGLWGDIDGVDDPRGPTFGSSEALEAWRHHSGNRSGYLQPRAHNPSGDPDASRTRSLQHSRASSTGGTELAERAVRTSRMRVARQRNAEMFEHHQHGFATHFGLLPRLPAMGFRGRNFGDFVRDDELDASYEGLLSLAEFLGEAKPRGTPADVVASLPSGVYRDWASPGNTEERCPICLDDYQPTDPVLKLSACSHWFHKGCIEQWLKGAGTCPVCRGRVENSRPRPEWYSASAQPNPPSTSRPSPSGSGQVGRADGNGALEDWDIELHDPDMIIRDHLRRRWRRRH